MCTYLKNNINCQSFKSPHWCLHPAAPKRLLGKPYCIEVFPPDERCKGCNLKTFNSTLLSPGQE